MSALIRKHIDFSPVDRLEQMISELEQSGRPVKVLDIGSGGATYWKRLVEKFGAGLHLTLLDPMKPSNLDELRKVGKVDYRSGFAPQDLASFQDGSFDIVLAFDVIEHLTKSDGYLLLYGMSRLSNGYSIVFTPTGFRWQPPSENNPWNAHISGWTPTELSKLGWRSQRGHAGLRMFFQDYGIVRYSNLLFRLLAGVSALLVRYLPWCAFAFSAIKSRSNTEPHHHCGV